MKKTVFLLALSMSIGSLFAAQGALNGLFTINANGDQVCFSQGNLQYQASTGTWRFAENQYDMIGSGNSNISASYSGWIDLFGWGTGDDPTEATTTYYAYDNYTEWGTNTISNAENGTDLWRTLTSNEWVYLFNTRTNAATLFALGSVNGVNGIIILPDNWTLPAGASFVASTTKGLEFSVFLSSYFNMSEGDNFLDNTYTEEQWSVMESAGAVFLPAAGFRYGTDFVNAGSDGYYWSSSHDNTYTAYYIHFYSYALSSLSIGSGNQYGYSVRLVQQFNAPAESVVLTGKFSVSANKQVSFSQGNLQYRAATDTWQFAENQWDIIGTGNENISATYKGWIDLFGFGTSGYANKYPWMTSTHEEDYTDGATGDIYNTYFDWGKYNPVVNGGNQAGIWYTMPRDEWDYLLHTRTDADRLQGIATVAGMKGYVLLPDNWQLPDMMWFTPLATSFSVNTYSVSQWRTMENAGAVFLPVAGYRDVTSVEDLDQFAYYWTSSADPDDMVQATEVLFGVSGGYTTMLIDWAPSKILGRSVRLVSETYGQGVEQVQRDKVQSTKELRNGVLVIRVGDKEYNAQGAVIR